MSGSEVILSILSTVITGLVLYIVSDFKKQQERSEKRLSGHVHDLRDDMQYLQVQLAILKTVIATTSDPQKLIEQLKRIDEEYQRKARERREAK